MNRTSAVPTLLGIVQDVKGPTLTVKLEVDTVSGLAFVNGHGYRIGQVGTFVRVPIGSTDLFGIVSQVGAGSVPAPLAETEPYGFRWMTVQLIGEGDRLGLFQRGVAQYPTVGDAVHLVTEQDLHRIYGRSDSPSLVRAGRLSSAESIPALVDLNRLITRHSAVVGTTGAGKSTTVAGLLNAIADSTRNPSTRVIVFDVHGEYASALRDIATVFRVTPQPAKGERNLVVPYWAMTFDELLSVTLGPLDGADRGAVLERIVKLKLESIQQVPRAGITPDNLTVDSPVPFSIHRLWFDLHCEIHATHYESSTESQSAKTWALAKDSSGKVVQPGDVMKIVPPAFRPIKDVKGDSEKIRLSQSVLNISNPVEGLGSKLRDPRLDFLFRPEGWAPNEKGIPKNDLDSLIKEWIGGDRPVSILDLAGVPPSILTNLIGVLLRIIYDALFWGRNLAEGGRERPLLLVLEEAHTYVSKGDSGPAATAVRRIVKEGRKYGIGALIVSQRPAEIDPTILSQCGTIFAMRLANSEDRSHVTSIVTENLEGLLAMLPVLRTGEAIILGESVHLPVRALIDTPSPNRRPDSFDPLVHDPTGPGGWNRRREPADYGDLVAVWRAQNPRSLSAIPMKAQKGGQLMKRVAVTSSNIASIGYESKSRTLEIEFNNGTIYQYFDVPVQLHDAFMKAPSKGTFHNTQIKGVFRYAKI